MHIGLKRGHLGRRGRTGNQAAQTWAAHSGPELFIIASPQATGWPPQTPSAQELDCWNFRARLRFTSPLCP